MSNTTNKSISIYFTLLACVFCICFIIDSFLELKVINVFGLPLTAGFFLITISYIVSDCLVEVYGYQKARFVMWMTFISHLTVVSLLQIACWLPSFEYWEGDQHFNYIFGLTPRITIVSILAFIVGSSTNAYVMSKMKVKYTHLGFKTRAFISTCAGECVDAFCFFPFAFYGLLPNEEIIKLIFIQMIGKIIYETSILPITNKIVEYIKKKDNIDTYDRDISYNLFSLKT